ncbi:MAG: hypothetical protein HWE22_01560 [Flavobacteriales bacterium]|nr:hypothetical protein [Flavobacteriales bacterium]
MKRTLGIILLGILSACVNSEPSSKKNNKPTLSADVEIFYFPFKETPTIYEYVNVTEGRYGSTKTEKSYIRFGLINGESKKYFLSSYDNRKLLTDSVTLVKKSDGFHIESYSFLDENGGRTIAQTVSGVAFPFSRKLDDNSTFIMNYITPVMNEKAKGKVSTSLSFQGTTESPNGTVGKKDCVKFTSKMNVFLKSMETTNQLEFTEESVIYDKRNLGLYQIITNKVDGSIQTKTFSKIVETKDW